MMTLEDYALDVNKTIEEINENMPLIIGVVVSLVVQEILVARIKK